MKNTILRSMAIVVFSSVFLAFSSTPSYAYRHYRGYYHHGHGIDVLVPLGFGLLAGALIAGAASPPPPPTVVYRQVPVVVAPPPPPVHYYSYTPAPQEPTNEVILKQVGITTSLLNVRSGPGVETSVVDQVHRGEVLDVIGENPGWLYVRTPDGVHGWVMARYTAVRTTPAG